MGTENGGDGCYPSGSKNSRSAAFETPQFRKRPVVTSRLTPADSSSATTARKRSPLKGNDKKPNSALFRKLGNKKPSDWKVEIAVSNASGAFEVDCKERNENIPEGRNFEKNKLTKPETKRALFSKNVDGYKNGSRVAPCQEESPASTVVVSNNVTEDLRKNHKESEDLSLIRNQLVQIENQQSSLLDLLQVRVMCLCLEIELSNFFLVRRMYIILFPPSFKLLCVNFSLYCCWSYLHVWLHYLVNPFDCLIQILP